MRVVRKRSIDVDGGVTIWEFGPCKEMIPGGTDVIVTASDCGIDPSPCASTRSLILLTPPRAMRPDWVPAFVGIPNTVRLMLFDLLALDQL